MKAKKNIRLLFCLFLAVIHLAGCGGLVDTPAATPIEATPSHTLMPTSTLTPTPTATPTSTPTPSLSPTPTTVPTLTTDEATRLLLDLLANNGNCQLPCLWGITPGESTFQEAVAKLIPLSSISYNTDFDYFSEKSRKWIGDIYPEYVEGGLKFITRVAFVTYPEEDIIPRIDDDIIQSVTFRAQAWKLSEDIEVFESKVFGERFAFYRLPNILSQFGKPASVLIKTYSLRWGDEWKYFYIVLLYPNQGIFIQYTTIHSGLVSDNKFLGCPANAHVELDLYPSGNSDYFWEYVWEHHGFVMGAYKPLEEVTSMSIDEFYDTFLAPTDACVETSSRIWPSGDD